MLADADCRAFFDLGVFRGDDSEGEVGEGEFAVGGDGQPGFEGCHCVGAKSDCEMYLYFVDGRFEGGTRKRP
jgi:hypothetical protein